MGLYTKTKKTKVQRQHGWSHNSEHSGACRWSQNVPRGIEANTSGREWGGVIIVTSNYRVPGTRVSSRVDSFDPYGIQQKGCLWASVLTHDLGPVPCACSSLRLLQ